MKYIINQSKLIKLIIGVIDMEIEEYSEHPESGQLALNDSEGKCIINYVPSNKELYYDHYLRELTSKVLPIGYDMDIFKEGVKEYFNSQFPDMIVKSVHGANIVSF
jgi:hypothetical protein